MKGLKGVFQDEDDLRFCLLELRIKCAVNNTSDCANAKADVNLRWLHMFDGTFFDVVAYIMQRQCSCFDYKTY